jgi:intergrase/recombinase
VLPVFVILLTCSFPYVRDWLNEHPFKNEPNAKLICNSYTSGSIKPEAMWTMMKYLRSRIIHLIKEKSISDAEEKEKLEYFLRTKKWNPYCIRHSAITCDSDFLPFVGLFSGLRQDEIVYMHDAEICSNLGGCNCNKLHVINKSNGFTIVVINWFRGNKKCYFTILPTSIWEEFRKVPNFNEVDIEVAHKLQKNSRNHVCGAP